MKIRLKQDFFGFPKDSEHESDDEGGVAFIKSSEDISEDKESSESSILYISLSDIVDNPDIFEIMDDAQEIEENTDDRVYPNFRNKAEVCEKLESIYKDIEVLGTLEVKGIQPYLDTLTNMAYTLEWVLGNEE